MGKKSVAVDMDGVIATYDGWKGFDHLGEPIPGALEFLTELQQNYKVVIFTTRCNIKRNREHIDEAHPGIVLTDTGARRFLGERIEAWFKKHGLPYDEVYTGQGKPICTAIVDDRAVPCIPESDASAYDDALRLIEALDGMYDKSDVSKV